MCWTEAERRRLEEQRREEEARTREMETERRLKEYAVGKRRERERELVRR